MSELTQETSASGDQAGFRPLKILLVASFRDRAEGLHYYFPPRRFLNGLIRLGHCVYALDDREAARTSTPFGSRRWGEAAMNRKIVRICDNLRPDVVIFYHADTLRRATLEQLRKKHPHTPIGFISLDPIDGVGNKNRTRGFDDLLDVFFITTADERVRQIAPQARQTVFIPNPVDPSIESYRSWEKTADECEWDVFFAGSTYSTNPRRQQLASTVGAAIEGLRCCFPGLNRPKLFGADFTETLGLSRMGLNLSITWGEPDYLYSSDRIAIYMGQGLLTFIDRRTGFGDLFTDDEIVFYEGDDDLIAKVRHYHEHDDERRRVAQNGWRKVHTTTSVTEVCSYLLDVLQNGRPMREYGWPDTRFAKSE